MLVAIVDEAKATMRHVILYLDLKGIRYELHFNNTQVFSNNDQMSWIELKHRIKVHFKAFNPSTTAIFKYIETYCKTELTSLAIVDYYVVIHR